jgi:putative hydrolase of the HAD superfamily
MSRDRRAVIFDLDDTLYPYRRFVLSGFAAVAAHLESTQGVPARTALRVLVTAWRGPDRGRELQACLTAFGLAPEGLRTLLKVLRGHRPRLRLPADAQRTLATLKANGWRTGVLTNGPKPIQARKISVLGISRYVDAVVYAREHGSGAGKPEPQPFEEIARQLHVPPARSVFVGDDERCDVGGAATAGMIPVRCLAWVSPFGSTAARAVAYRLTDIPDMAHALVEEAGHAA